MTLSTFKRAIVFFGPLAVAVVFAAVWQPTPSSALPGYAGATGQGCGTCHVNPAGGGPRTAIGQAFEAIPTHASNPGGAWQQLTQPAPTAPPAPAPTTPPPPAAATPTPAPAPAAGEMPAPAGGPPAIAIVAPMPGQVAGTSALVRVNVANFALAPDAIGKESQPGTGHMHVLVDGRLVGMVGTDSFELTGLTAGAHMIKVELHNNDHTALSPPAEASVSIGVGAATALPKAGGNDLPPWVMPAGVLLLMLGLVISLRLRQNAAER